MPDITVPLDFTKGEITIPNAVSANAGEGINGDLQEIITKYEKELLLKALGKTQYDELQAALVDLPSADQKWQDLVAGSGSYQGIRRILKNFIYCHQLRFDEIRLATTGAGKDGVTYSSVAEYNQKYVERWNEFVCWYQDGNDEDLSLEQFLTDTTDLDESKFQLFNYENSFGL